MGISKIKITIKQFKNNNKARKTRNKNIKGEIKVLFNKFHRGTNLVALLSSNFGSRKRTAWSKFWNFESLGYLLNKSRLRMGKLKLNLMALLLILGLKKKTALSVLKF
jgi:hypothetical protein